MTDPRVAEAAEATAALIAAVRAGEVTASPATLHRLEGALIALQLVGEGRFDPDSILDGGGREGG